jgi:hypothetical protein
MGDLSNNEQYGVPDIPTGFSEDESARLLSGALQVNLKLREPELRLYAVAKLDGYTNQEITEKLGVVNGQMTGCCAQLIFPLMSGMIGAALVLWFWDLIRWIQTRIVKPAFEVKYSVNSKGMLRG